MMSLCARHAKRQTMLGLLGLLLECPELADTGAPKPGRRKLGLQKKGTVGFHSSHRRMPFGQSITYDNIAV